MPFYEYECTACKFYVEALQKISDPLMKKCPSCKKSTLKKLVSAPAFRLAGGGWYETDFKSDKENKRNLVGEEKESSSSDKGETKSDTAAEKPDSKAETKPAADTKSEKPKGKTSSSSTSSKKSTVKAKPKAPAKKK